jgi:hypothetical protein
MYVTRGGGGIQAGTVIGHDVEGGGGVEGGLAPAPHLVRADAETTLGMIAVGAKDLKAGREIVLAEPCIKIGPADTDLLAVLGASTMFDMIDLEKLDLTLAATDTDAGAIAVMVDDLAPELGVLLAISLAVLLLTVLAM